MTTPTRRTAEVARRLGEAIYERDIRPQVEAEHLGEYVAIDLDSGDYAIGDMVVTASRRLRERRPDADVWSVRVGYRALASFGGGSRRRSE